MRLNEEQERAYQALRSAIDVEQDMLSEKFWPKEPWMRYRGITAIVFKDCPEKIQAALEESMRVFDPVKSEHEQYIVTPFFDWFYKKFDNDRDLEYELEDDFTTSILLQEYPEYGWVMIFFWSDRGKRWR